MSPISTRTQLWLIGAGYAAVLGFATVKFYARYAWENANPDIAMASSGMYAFGDALLAAFIAMLLLLPTVFLVRLLSQRESSATRLAKVLLVVGSTALLALAGFTLDSSILPEELRAVCFFRLAGSPILLLLMTASWFLAKFSNAQRLISFAVVAEGFALVAAFALLFLSHR